MQRRTVDDGRRTVDDVPALNWNESTLIAHPSSLVRRLAIPVIVFWLLLIVLLVPQAQAAAQSTNLLRNPGFEGSFFAWSGINEIQVAHDWTPWWHEDPNHEPAYFRPEYKRADAAVFPNRVRSGGSAQQWFTFHASHYAGMYQQVFNVTPGQRYRFTIWAQVWSSTEDDPNTSVLPANPNLQIGIDPTGNWSPYAGTVVWSGPGSMGNHIDRWGEISVEATAASSTITVFMRTNPSYANKHNDMYWDDASLMAVAPPPPTEPPPTNTPLPATEAPPVTATPPPPPTATPAPPTDTPTATETAVPTATATPSATPEPTQEPTAEPTAVPTMEPTVEPTVEPTAPAPTDTRDPRPTPTAPDPSDPGPEATAVAEVTTPSIGNGNGGENTSEGNGSVLTGPMAPVVVALASVLLLLGLVFLVRRFVNR